jgi:hypothetical protein
VPLTRCIDIAFPLVRDKEPGVAVFVTENSAATPDTDTNINASGNSFFVIINFLISCFDLFRQRESRE